MQVIFYMPTKSARILAEPHKRSPSHLTPPGSSVEKVGTEMSLHVLAYNLKRMIAILGPQPLIQAIRAA